MCIGDGRFRRRLLLSVVRSSIVSSSVSRSEGVTLVIVSSACGCSCHDLRVTIFVRGGRFRRGARVLRWSLQTPRCPVKFFDCFCDRELFFLYMRPSVWRAKRCFSRRHRMCPRGRINYVTGTLRTAWVALLALHIVFVQTHRHLTERAASIGPCDAAHALRAAARRPQTPSGNATC